MLIWSDPNPVESLGETPFTEFTRVLLCRPTAFEGEKYSLKVTNIPWLEKGGNHLGIGNPM